MQKQKLCGKPSNVVKTSPFKSQVPCPDKRPLLTSILAAVGLREPPRRGSLPPAALALPYGPVSLEPRHRSVRRGALRVLAHAHRHAHNGTGRAARLREGEAAQHQGTTWKLRGGPGQRVARL